MRKILDFFINPKKIGFHFMLAIVTTIVTIVVIVLVLGGYTRHGSEKQMPSFIGSNVKTLISDSLDAKFVFVVSEHVYDQACEEGTILKQNPLPNEWVKEDRKVYFTVATPTPPMVMMPLLIDVSLRQAEIMLDAIGLKLGKTILKPSPYKNAVLEQLYQGRPIAPGQPVPMGEKIILVVGKDIKDLPKSDSLKLQEQKELLLNGLDESLEINPEE